MKLQLWRIVGGVCLALPLLAADLQQSKDLYQEGKYQEAVHELHHLVENTPENFEARYYMALSLIELERIDEAQQQLEAIPAEREGAPSDLDLRTARARILVSRKQFDAAATALKEIIDLNPDAIQPRMLRAETDLQRKDYQTAAVDAEKVIALDPTNAYAYYYAGIAFSNLRRPDKMADYFSRFLKLSPNAPEAPKVQSLLKSLRR